MSLADKALSGFAWSYLNFFGGRMVKLLTTAVLTRLLAPQDFGVMAFALLTLGLLDCLRDLGLKDALIYNERPAETLADTAFAMNVMLGVAQGLLVFTLAPLAVHLIDDPRCVTIVRLLSLSFVINALGNTHDGLTQKSLAFKRQTLPELASAASNAIVSVAIAFSGFGVWALVAGYLTGSVVRTTMRWRLNPWRPSWRYSPADARALLGFGQHIVAFEIIGVVLYQIDQWMVVSLLGGVQLGYYMIAMRLPELVTTSFCSMLTRVLFPTFSTIKNDPARLQTWFLTSMTYTAFLTVPAGVGLAAVAPELIPVFFGQKWYPAVALTQILALRGVVVTLPWTVGDIFKAQGRPDISTRLLIFEAMYTLPLVVLFTTHWRLAIMAAIANLIAVGISCIVRLWMACRQLGFPFVAYLRVVGPPMTAAAIMFAAITFWRGLVANWPMTAILATSVLIGAASYVIAVGILQPSLLRDIVVTVRRLVLRQPAARDNPTA